jgi:hypothetical protein
MYYSIFIQILKELRKDVPKEYHLAYSDLFSGDPELKHNEYSQLPVISEETVMCSKFEFEATPRTY